MMLLLFALALPAAAAAEAPPSEFQRSAALFQSKCSKCHTVGKGDRVGPDLKGVTVRRTPEWLAAFLLKPSAMLDSDPEAKKLVEKFNGVRMEDPNLTSAQIDGLVGYLEAVSAGGAAADGEADLAEDAPETQVRLPDEGRRPWWPGLAAAVALFGLAAAAWHFSGLWPAAVLLMASAGAGYWSLGGRAHHRLLGDQRGYAPAQPIAFSHQQHAGALGMACLSCHHGAEKSDVAGVPPLEACMACHAVVKKRAADGQPSPELAKLAAVWDARGALAWNRVHSLPRYTHFSHRAHVADGLRCQECHGPVQEMDRLRQASSLSMGWCVNCHRLKPGQAPSHWKRAGGPLDCAACHW